MRRASPGRFEIGNEFERDDVDDDDRFGGFEKAGESAGDRQVTQRSRIGDQDITMGWRRRHLQILSPARIFVTAAPRSARTGRTSAV
ncbi:MAG: hypothetical protein ING19_02700 [Azospirillum sp.]|nr:hypothetical protein [Azospirillum sp.]